MTPQTADTLADDFVLSITRRLDAPRELVFKVWSQPEHLARWWGPKDFTLPSCQMDFRPGGAFRFTMRGANGKDHTLQGVYREIVPPERLSFSWRWVDEAEDCAGPETQVTVTLESQGNKTLLTLHQARFDTVSARDSHGEGWGESLDRLTDYVGGL